MAKNLIRYEGRVINRKLVNGTAVPGEAVLEKSKNGKGRVRLVIAEQFQEKNSAAHPKYKDATKGPDDYVNTETKWHRIDVWGSLEAGSALLALVTDPQFNHGTIVEVDASYRSEGYTSTKDNVRVQDDRESIFLDGDPKGDGFDTTIGIKTSNAGNLLGASDGFKVPIFAGGDIPEIVWGGGGAVPAPAYDENVGF